MTIHNVAIVGAGAMGRGVAQISAAAGHRTYLYDQNAAQATSARADIVGQWTKLVAKNKLTEEQSQVGQSNLEVVDSLEALHNCDLVIEAIVESLDAKQNLFRTLETIVKPDCILVTNTSSLSVTAIGQPLTNSGRFAGLHFFNPVPLMRVTEVIGGLSSDEKVLEALVEFVTKIGHKPVRAKDTPGFIVNHAGRGYGTEALKIAGEDVADFETIDVILREVCGFRMGPFELLDLTGLDVSHPVMESIYHQYYQEPRYRPSPITKQRLDGGFLGRKTNRGFYAYKSEQGVLKKHFPKADRFAQVLDDQTYLDLAKTLWIAPAVGSVFEQKRNRFVSLLRERGVEVEDAPSPSPRAVCVVLPIGTDVTTECIRLSLDSKRTVGVDVLFEESFEQRLTLMTNPMTDGHTVVSFLRAMPFAQTQISVISDSAGFIAQRVIATVINIAADMAQQNVASPEDIDTAVLLGLGYPKGPLAWGDQLGTDVILCILEQLFETTKDPRYRPSPWLARRAKLKCSLKHREVRHDSKH